MSSTKWFLGIGISRFCAVSQESRSLRRAIASHQRNRYSREPTHTLYFHTYGFPLFKAPFERIQIILQTQDELTRLPRLYAGRSDCYAKLVAQDGFFSLWRGSTMSILQGIARQGFFVVLMFKTPDIENQSEVLIRYLLAESLWYLIPAPFNVIRTRLACDLNAWNPDDGRAIQRQFTGSRHVFERIWQVDGISGLFNGYTASVLHLVLFSFMYVPIILSLSLSVGNGVSKSSLSLLTRDSFFTSLHSFDHIPFPIKVIFASWILYPFETLGRRIIVAANNTESALKYQSTYQAFVRIVGEKGISILFQGQSVWVMKSCVEILSLAMFVLIGGLFSSTVSDVF